MIIILLQAYFLFHDVQLIRANGGGPVDLFPYPTTGRLPTWIKPIHYNLSLEVYLESASYNGSVGIDFEVVNTTDKIVLSMLDIVTNNDTCKVVMMSELEDMPIKKQSYDNQLQFYVIHLGRVLQAGETGSVSVDFRGTLNSILVGFYLSTYKNSNGETIRVASTQFSPTDARRAFPCFDEPGFKATFDISIERDNKTKSLSNMPLMETSAVIGKEQRFLDRFERTVKMSTYLVGFLVSDFEYRSSNALNETEFKVWSRKEALNQTNYALDVGPKLLQYLENYFGTKYPLPKLDMAAIPNFKFRGMENWGLILYRESAVLFDPQVSNIESKRNIIQVIAHEIAHMWFGNLVTPKWWSELWLKEGFANYMGYKAVDDKEPSWRMMDYLVQTSNFEAFDKDSLRSSHPINVHVDHPDRIAEIFDAISYQKGACLIRMMEHFLTKSIFKQGMQSYIHDLKFDNAEQQDLWRFLNQAWETSDLYSPERTVEVIMNTWTLQDGFPVVTAKRNNSDLYLTQERFLLQENEIPSNSSTPEFTNRRWWIPISFVKESSPNFNMTQPKVWMPPTKDSVTFSVPEVMVENEWFLLNVQKAAFYRVNYDTHNWKLLTQQLFTDHQTIHNLNRAQILDDSWNLARTGLLDYYTPINMTLYIKDERDLTVWKMFAGNYDYVYGMAKTTSNITYFDNYIRKLIIPLYNATGFSDSPSLSYQMQSLTSLATKWACRVGYEPCVETSLSLFNQWLELPDNDSSELIPSNVKTTVLCEGIKNASPEVWNQTFEIYLNSNVQTEKANLLAALACTENVEMLERYLNMSLDPSSGIIKQDSPTVFQNVARSKDGRDLAWALVKGKWRYIYQYFGSGSFYLKSIIESVAKTFNTDILVKEFEEFSETQKDYLGSGRQAAKNALELAVINTQWMKNRYPQTLQYMSEN